MSKRLTLTIARVAAGSLGAVGEAAEDLLLLLGPGAEPRLLLVVDGDALGLVDEVVEGLLVARAGRPAAQDLTVDDQRQLGEMGGAGTLVALAPELHGGVGLIVEQPIDPFELALRVLADAIRDLGILALDDRPQAYPPGQWPPARVRRSEREGRAVDPPCHRVYAPPATAPRRRRGADRPHRSRATAIALTAMAPAARSAAAARRQRRPRRDHVIDQQHPAPGDRSCRRVRCRRPTPRATQPEGARDVGRPFVAAELELGDRRPSALEGERPAAGRVPRRPRPR